LECSKKNGTENVWGLGLAPVLNCIPRKRAYRTPCPAEAWIQAWNDSAEAGKILPSFAIVARRDHAVPHCPRRPKAMVCGVGVFGQRKSLPKPQAPFHRCRSHCRRSSMSILIWDAKTHVNVSRGTGFQLVLPINKVVDLVRPRGRASLPQSLASSGQMHLTRRPVGIRQPWRHKHTVQHSTHAA